jgi:RimJ/RimL family protein N-acetyltransferase
MKNPFLIGARVYLRPLEPDDAATLQPWMNDGEVTRHLLMYRPHSLSDEKAFIERTRSAERELVLAIALRRGDRLIGTTGIHSIHPKDRSAVFGIVIGDKREWGKGYGTEATALMVRHAFDTLNLNRVSLHVLEYNARGIRAYEKVGFRREGLFRKDTFREGRFWNTIAMGILREEWEPRAARVRKPKPPAGRARPRKRT